MLEQQWLSSTRPAEMLAFIRPQASERKLRLFACACCRQRWDQLDSQDKTAIEVAEKFSEGLVTELELQAVRQIVRPKLKSLVTVPTYQADLLREYLPFSEHDVRRDVQALLIRLIFNPFRRVEMPRTKIERAEKNPNGPGGTIYLSCPWQTPDVLAVTQGIYDNRDASGFGELWDCLETAGCDNEEIRRALMWEQRCPKCLGEGWVTIRIASFFEPLGKGTPVKDKCLTCNGTGWLPIPGEPFCPRGHWVIDLILGKE